MSLLPESHDRVPGLPGARPAHPRFGRSIVRHAARVGVAAGLAVTAIAAVAPHAAAAASADRTAKDTAAVTLTAAQSSRDALPHSGDGTLPVLLAGAGSLAIGGLALWFGGRSQASRANGTRRATG